MDSKPKIVTLCGSSKYADIMAVCAWLIEKQENAIALGLHFLPVWYGDIPDHLAEHEGVSDKMDKRHLNKIDISNEIFVVNYHNYIGDSTTNEIMYALGKEMPIRWFTNDPIGEQVENMISTFLGLK
jgi:hypothetical protein